VALWQSLVQRLKPTTRIAVATALTLPAAQCRSAAVSAWKHQAAPVDNDVPAVFAIGP
jgi:16S rRNA (cytidine1402-2'-O)-methyltransferase